MNLEIGYSANIAYGAAMRTVCPGKKAPNLDGPDKAARAALAIFSLVGYENHLLIEGCKIVKDCISYLGFREKADGLRDWKETDSTHKKAGNVFGFANGALSVAVMTKKFGLFDLGKYCTNTIGSTRLYGIAAKVGMSQIKSTLLVAYLCTLALKFADSNHLAYQDSAVFSHAFAAFTALGLTSEKKAGGTAKEYGVSHETAYYLDLAAYTVLCSKIAVISIGGIFLYSSGAMLVASAIVMTADLAHFVVLQILLEMKNTTPKGPAAPVV